jgi:uncharacterized membrane protein
MNKGLTLVGGIGLGAALMYVLDPDRGRRRRALFRDQLVHAANILPDAIDATARDLSNRTRGLVAEVRSIFDNDEVPDEVLVDRIRSKMGRVVSHPHAIEVTANQGRVTLRGPVLTDEVDDLLSCVSSIKGVSDVDHQLKVHAQAGSVPGLQGGRPRPGHRFELMEENWSPTARLIVGAAGGGLAAYGIGRRDPLGIGLSVIGLGLLTRGVTNTEIKRLVGTAGGRRATEIQKNINVAAPVEQVYGFWTNYVNFPRFMTNVREVRDTGEGRSHWTIEGTGGVPVEWDAVITRRVPNEALAWKSVEGAAFENAGFVRFEPNPDGTTRVDVKLSCNPVAGEIGHVLARLFGADPKSQMHQDLMRMKMLVETGSLPSDTSESRPQARGASTR